jgi:hypothetical protein
MQSNNNHTYEALFRTIDDFKHFLEVYLNCCILETNLLMRSTLKTLWTKMGSLVVEKNWEHVLERRGVVL